MTLACVQSFDAACWQSVKTAWLELRESYASSLVRSNLEAVTLPDICDMLGMMMLANDKDTRRAAQSRALAIMMCVDPMKMSKVLSSMWPGALAVLATLRSRFVFAMGLGATVGRMVLETIQQVTHGRLERLSPESRTWADVGLQQTCTLTSFCCCLYVPGIANALNSALQGSTTLTKVMFAYFRRQKALPNDGRSTISKSILPLLEKVNLQPGKEEELAKWFIAIIGLYYQVRHRPGPFNLAKVPLAPLYLMEYLLTRLASVRSL
jgi:hypothetical protein